MANQPTSLYIHIPFCAQKCAYCDFVSFRSDPAFRSAYMNTLCKEIALYGISAENDAQLENDTQSGNETYAKKRILHTIFIGGGTPSLLTKDEIEQLGSALNRVFELAEIEEFTIEANPGTLDEDKLKAWKRLGVNRISMGVQSMDDILLKKLGRIHTASEARQSYTLLRQLGFDNINLDIMFGLPGQTIENLLQTLDKIIELGPEHISAYSLKIEEGTPFDALYSKGLIEVPSEDTERQMYHALIHKLASAGYNQYEISNFSKPGKTCAHNLVYWKGAPYYAFGLAAHGYVDGVRTGNYADWPSYKAQVEVGKKPIESRESISEAEAAFEYIMLGLRLNEGVDLKAYEEQFGMSILESYKMVIEKQTQQNTLIIEKGYMKLTGYGMDIANVVIAEFM